MVHTSPHEVPERTCVVRRLSGTAPLPSVANCTLLPTVSPIGTPSALCQTDPWVDGPRGYQAGGALICFLRTFLDFRGPYKYNFEMSKSITINGIFYKTMRAAAAAHGLSDITWSNRVHQYGWDPARAVTEPLHKPALHTIDGITAPRTVHAKRLGIDTRTIAKRLWRGSTLEDALSIPARTQPLRKFASHAEAKAARNAARAARVAENIAKIRNYKATRPCKDCGGKFHPDAMDFDHCRGKKLFEISKAGAKPLLRIATEIAKCDLVCANCHRIRTASRRNSV